MKFVVIPDHTRFILKVDSDNLIGYRAESPYPKIILKSQQLILSYKPLVLPHPDILALLCLVTFYPFIQPDDYVIFPEPITRKLADKLKVFPLYGLGNGDQYRKIANGINVAVGSISDTLENYQGDDEKMVISFGGGLDSTAVACLYPKATLVHERPLSKGHTGTEVLMGLLEKRNGATKGIIVETNNKTLVEPIGWTAWISCIASSLIVAMDLQVKNIMLGSSLGSILASSRFVGSKDSFPNNSIWVDLLYVVGLNLCAPIAGLSEISLGKIIETYGPKYLSYGAWCDKDEGFCCRRCIKCLRRYLLIADMKDLVDVVDWDSYKTVKIRQILANTAILGPSMLYLLLKNRKRLPKWVTENLSPQLKFNAREWKWIDHWYHRSLRYMPDTMHTGTWKRIIRLVKPMSEEEMDILENYSCMV